MMSYDVGLGPFCNNVFQFHSSRLYLRSYLRSFGMYVCVCVCVYTNGSFGSSVLCVCVCIHIAHLSICM
jgi:hypothetical protein